jgi:HTH-type transcriptional regulator / antitoxin HipB
LCPHGNIREETYENQRRDALRYGVYHQQKRKQDKLTLVEAAALCNVNYRFLSELENVKAMAQVGKVLHVLYGLGINVIV